MRILSIDIGTKNCAFYIEDFDENEIIKLKKIPKFQTENIIESLYKIGTRVYWSVENFEKESEGDIFTQIISYLDSNRKYWDKCNGIIIEKQMKINYNAQVIQHFIFSYFKNIYGSFKYISDINATRKTQVLNAPKKMVKKERKKWAVDETIRLLKIRKDLKGLKIIDVSKADDLSDCCLQLKAFQKLVFIDGGMP